MTERDNTTTQEIDASGLTPKERNRQAKRKETRRDEVIREILRGARNLKDIG